MMTELEKKKDSLISIIAHLPDDPITTELEKKKDSLISIIAHEPNSPPLPKLSLRASPPIRPDPPEMCTPPFNIPGSIPFRWEEAPGKPKTPIPPPRTTRSIKSETSKKVLELPPRLQASSQSPSPTTVLGKPTCQLCHLSAFVEESWKRWAKGRLQSVVISSNSDLCYFNPIYDVSCRFGCRGRSGENEEGEEEGLGRSSKSLPATSVILDKLYGNLRKVRTQKRDDKV